MYMNNRPLAELIKQENWLKRSKTPFWLGFNKVVNSFIDFFDRI